MRLAVFFGAIVMSGASFAAAQDLSASASLGTGLIDGQPAALGSADLDVGYDSFAIGLAARARFVDGELIETDWDQLSDAGRVLRYLTWMRPLGDESAVSVAAGHLGDVTLGHGSVINGYASGIDFDRARAGAELRATVGRAGAHLVVSDLTSGELFGLRLLAPVSPVVVGVSVVADRPVGELFAVVDLEIAGRRGWAGAALYADLASRVGHGGGAHFGLELSARRGESTYELTGEGRLSTAAYVPGWISPLYLRDRDQIGEDSATSIGVHADEMGRAGLSWQASIRGQWSVASARFALATRPGLPWLATGHLGFPAFAVVQAGLTAAYERTGDGALAAEARVRLPRSLFFRAELARQYTRESDRWMPLWLATGSIGAALE